MAPHDRHAAARAAAVMGVSVRSMRHLRAQALSGKPLPPLGRTPFRADERARVRALVLAEHERQGVTAGWRPVLAALRRQEKGISPELVKVALRERKAQARTQATRAIEAARQGLDVLGRDTVWGEDTTHLGRLEDGTACEGEHIRDRGSWRTVSLTVGPTPTAVDVLHDLRRAGEERGGLPLVLQVDNGSIYAAAPVRAAMEAEHVIVLRSRVHTPTDNAATEHAHGEVKAETGLGKGVVLQDHSVAIARLEPALASLDHARLRPSRGYLAAAELDAMLPRGDACVDRIQFYERARAAMKAAVLGIEDPAAARQAEREAVITTLCEHGLARRRVGRRPKEGSIPMPTPSPLATVPSGACREKG